MTDAQRTETWWTPDQLRLVEDRSRVWERATFSPSDMLLIQREPGEIAKNERRRERRVTEAEQQRLLQTCQSLNERPRGHGKLN